MPYRQKNSPYWTIRVPENGIKVRRSSGTTNFKEAQALENRLNSEAYNLETWGQEPSRIFDDLMGRYLDETQHKPNYERNLYSVQRLKEHFAGMILNDLPISAIQSYKTSRKVATATIRKELSLFSTAITYAQNNWKWKIENVIKGRLPDKGKGRVRWITRKEAQRLVDVAEKSRAKHLAGFIKLALNTGMRKGEILNLTWDRVDLENKLIYLRPEDQKSGQRGSIPLNKGSIHALESLYKKDNSHVFMYRGQRVSEIKKGFKSACDKAKIFDFKPHDLRHTFASWHIQNGTPIKTLQELMRHEDIASTMIYAHLSPDSLREASDSLSFV